MLARLGGDEFAALAFRVRGRKDAEEIAHRLIRCFDEPYYLEECVLHGSASIGIAIDPKNGTTREALLAAADAAMYIHKNRQPS
jgi:diguanylate cyclase (GGDEF)-like protein